MADPKQSNTNRHRPGQKPKTKEDAIREMFEQNPEQAAKLIRDILKGYQD